MKRPLFTMLLLTLFLRLPLFGQTAYKGQLYVSGESFQVQGSMLRVQMRVSYDGDVLNSGETLNFTPVLKTSTQQQPLSSVVINGRERGKFEQRSAALKNLQRQNIPVVRRDSRRGRYYFDYDTTVPYSPWMERAALYIESEESGWTGRTHLYEDQLINQITLVGERAVTASGQSSASFPPLPAVSSPSVSSPGRSPVAAAPFSWVPMLGVSASLRSEQTVSGQIALGDSHRLGALQGRRFCEAVSRELTRQLSDHLQSEGASVSQLDICGYGTPIGNYRHNEQLSAQRSRELKQWLMEQQVAGAVSVTWNAEDWETIIRLTQRDPTIRLRSAALDIMNSVEVVNGRESQLQMLGGGETYTQLVGRVFPRVQRLQFTATIQHRQPLTDAAMNMQSLYETAARYARGSRESDDIIDLAARLYPDNAVAAINAAGVALTHGDLEKAERYLRPWQTDSRAYQNLGVLRLLQGQRDRAEVYLRMAESQGVEEARLVLDSFRQ